MASILPKIDMASSGNQRIAQIPEGISVPSDAFVVIVRTEWNDDIITELENGCKKVFDTLKVRYGSISVPGAVELIFGTRRAVEKFPQAKAVITLGCVIKGDTPHFDFVCQSVTAGVTELNIQLNVPVIFGVLTVNTVEQAWQRLGGIHGHKGEEAAISAIKMMAI